MDFVFNLILLFLGQLMLFFINLMVAREAGESLFGDFSAATNFLILMGTLTTLGIDSIITYYVPKLYVKNKFDQINYLIGSIRAFIQPIYLVIAAFGLLVSLVLILASQIFINTSLAEITHPFFLFLWGTIVLALYYIVIQFFRVIGSMQTAILIGLLQIIIYFLLTLVLYTLYYIFNIQRYSHYFVHLMLLSFIASYLLIVILSYFLQKKAPLRLYQSYLKGKQKEEWKKKIFGYTVQNLNRFIFTTIPLLMLELLDTHESSVGLFSAVMSIITLGIVAVSPISFLISPKISGAMVRDKEHLLEILIKYLLIATSISLVVAGTLGLLMDDILILYKSKFINALPYAYASLVNIVLYAITMPIAILMVYSEKGSDIGAKLTISFIILQITACAILIYRFDLLGAIICYVGINVLYCLAVSFYAVRICRAIK
ncbi:MAG: hypothetical protein Q8M40_03835 [Legionella sp.]|nr:hypothetical protein [Legionella sp.]